MHEQVRNAGVVVALALLLGSCAGGAEGEGEGEAPVSCDGDADCADGAPLCLGVCVAVTAAPEVVDAAPRDADLSVRALVDIDPDPAVFEAALRAEEREVSLIDGTTTTAWVYIDDNGDDVARLPGPRIEVDAGTRLRITFRNELPVPTSIHWHGIGAPPNMDGADINGGTVAPGGSFLFNFVAGEQATGWYHPQQDGDVHVERGLSGPFIVRDPDGEPAVDAERVLVLDDVLLDGEGQVVPALDGEVKDGLVGFAALHGRHGNHVLVNGVENPFIDVTPGTVERWRLINAANARFFSLALEGVVFRQIGADGGLAEAPIPMDVLRLAPGERVDVLIAVAGTGEVPIISAPVDPDSSSDGAPFTVATVRYAAVAQDPPTPQPAVSRDIPRLAALERPDKTVVIDVPRLVDGRVAFATNGQTWPAVTPLVGAYGQINTWEVDNRSGLRVPFHLGGQRFQVLSYTRDGEGTSDELFLVWKDTIVIPPKCKVRFVVRYTLDQGPRLFQSTILEQAVRGLMGILDIRSMMG